jgi:hypothetical protein
VRLDVANAHLLTRLSHGQLAAMLARPEQDQRLRAAQAAERAAREALEVAGQRRGHAEAAVREAVLRGQEHTLLLDLANEARAAETAARQAAAEAGAAVDALLEGGPSEPVEAAIRQLFLAVATGCDTAEQRQEVNRGLAGLGVRILLDVRPALPLMGLAIGDGPVDWQPMDPELTAYSLQAGAAEVSYWADGKGADWPA